MRLLARDVLSERPIEGIKKPISLQWGDRRKQTNIGTDCFAATADRDDAMEPGLYTLLDLSSRPDTGIRISAEQRVTEAIAAAQRADEVGLDAFVVGNTITWTLLSRLHW